MLAVLGVSRACLFSFARRFADPLTTVEDECRYAGVVSESVDIKSDDLTDQGRRVELRLLCCTRSVRGASVQQVHNVVRGSSGTLLTNVASVVAGFKAATRVVKERLREEGGRHNGG